MCGCEGGALSLWDVRKPGAPLATIANAHGARIRGLVADFAARVAAADAASIDALCDKLSLCATASSDGYVKLWDVDRLAQSGSDADKAQPLAALNVGARFTSLCAVQTERAADVGVVARTAAPSRGKKKRHRDSADAPTVVQQTQKDGVDAKGRHKRKQAGSEASLPLAVAHGDGRTSVQSEKARQAAEC